MKAFTSNTAGIILLKESRNQDLIIFDIPEGEEIRSDQLKMMYSNVNDWKEIEASSQEMLLKLATDSYWLNRTILLFQYIIRGLDESLEEMIFEELVENLSSRVSSELVLSHLLIAPLKDNINAEFSVKHAMSKGYVGIGTILKDLIDYQPQIYRFTDLWLGLSEKLFADLTLTKEQVWLKIISENSILDLINASSIKEFDNKWNLLTFHFDNPKSRSGISLIGKNLSASLFPNKSITTKLLIKTQHEELDLQEKEIDKNVYEEYNRVKKQIDAIEIAVSKGKDSIANKYLKELISHQISLPRNIKYAVQSLCSIAKISADLYRFDFESKCLDEALKLDPNDPWTLIMKGDYLKRQKKYDQAILLLKRAQSFGENEVALSSQADVYAEQKNFTKAIELYKIIPGWQENPTILTALADNNRKMGNLKEAKKDYQKIIRLAKRGVLVNADEDRAFGGLAEIYKLQGDLKKAKTIYKKIIRKYKDTEKEKSIYRLGLCNVLKLNGEFENAYQLIEKVIEFFPFMFEAKIIRSSILGLIGRENEGLKDLSGRIDSRMWREWILRYYRGLLFFKLERYEDAKENLIEHINESNAFDIDVPLIRMASALCYLRENNNVKAERILSEIPALSDSRMTYLSLVLKLHTAIQRNEVTKIEKLKDIINDISLEDDSLENAVLALKQGDIEKAFKFESDALLKLAA